MSSLKELSLFRVRIGHNSLSKFKRVGAAHIGKTNHVIYVGALNHEVSVDMETELNHEVNHSINFTYGTKPQ